jgi:proteasome lid subunit RPN8/RPN11
MNVVSLLLLATALLVNAAPAVSECLRSEVEAHVREQFAIYGPRSVRHEYFGFIYQHEGILGSAVTRSRPCVADKCVADSNDALLAVPRGAKVLGEWHTHPHGGSASLSREDVRGAYNNRHISCYFAFYSTPSGEIHAWNPTRVSVPIAMASRARIGHYRRSPPAPPSQVLASN